MDMASREEKRAVMKQVAESPRIKNWLSRLDEVSWPRYRQRFTKFLIWLREDGGAFAGYSPDDLVDYQKATDNGTLYDVLDEVQRYINGLDGLRYKTLMTYYTVIRSFFAHNRAELPKDRHFHIRADKPPVLGTLTVEELRDVVIKANPTYRAIVISMFQGGMDLAAFDYWNRTGWESLTKQLYNGAGVIRIEQPGRKRKRNKQPFYTLIGSDAIKTIREYLPYRPTEESFQAWETRKRKRAERDGVSYRPREYKPEFIFYNKDLQPVNKSGIEKYWIRLLRRLGLIGPKKKGHKERTGKNIHEMRDVFRSQWEKSPVKGSVAEFMMGHDIDPNEYNKACRDDSWTLREYRSALPMLQIMSSGRPFGRVDLEEVDRLDDEVERLRGELADAKIRLESMTPIGIEVANLLKDPIVVETLKAIAANGRPREV